jgi:hypothetical protein
VDRTPVLTFVEEINNRQKYVERDMYSIRDEDNEKRTQVSTYY